MATVRTADLVYVFVSMPASASYLGRLPTVLLWGENDPWITMNRANKMLDLMPSATFRPLRAGHCPHDEVPGQFNSELLAWLAESRL